MQTAAAAPQLQRVNGKSGNPRAVQADVCQVPVALAVQACPTTLLLGANLARIFRCRPCKSKLRRPEARTHKQAARPSHARDSQGPGFTFVTIRLSANPELMCLSFQTVCTKSDLGYYLCASGGNERPPRHSRFLVTLPVARGASVQTILRKGRIYIVCLAMKQHRCSAKMQQPLPGEAPLPRGRMQWETTKVSP